MSSTQTLARPLDGILVVAMEQAVAAPLCTARLLDAGARVIKIERKEGDFARQYDDAALGDSSYFAWTNHGKESVVLDIKQKDDAALLHGIIAKADVFIQNLAPGAAQRAGFGSEALREQHPALVTCDISGYGNSEAMNGMKAYDLLVQAESGLVSVSGAPGEFGRIGVSLCDIGAGVTAHAGIMEALLLRFRTGRGSAISVSLFDVAAEWMSVPLIHGETGKGAPERVGLRHPSIAPYGAFPTREGKLTLISIQNEREWQRLCRSVLGRPEMAEQALYASNVLRVANRDRLDTDIAAITSTLTSEALRTALLEASIAYGALNSVEELSSHPALRRRQVSNTDERALQLPAHPVLRAVATELCASESCTNPRVPRLGEHTERVRKEFTAAAAGSAG